MFWGADVMDGTCLVNLDECRKFAKTWLNGEVCSALKCIFLSVLAVLGKVYYLKVLTLCTYFSNIFNNISQSSNPSAMDFSPQKNPLAQAGFFSRRTARRHVTPY
jgi:hypothetical protein